MRNKEISLILLMLLCFFPAYAYTDLTPYTYAGGLVTPAYGLFLNSDYGYNVNNAAFLITGENFESNGFYHIYNTNNLEVLINISGIVQATSAGNLYICVNDGNGGTQCQSIGRYDDVGLEVNFTGLFDLQNAGSREGLIDYWLRLAYDVGGTSDSYHYRGYFDIEKAYSKKRNIIITSPSNLSSGVVTFTLNSTITNEFNPIDVIYDTDESELTLSGTSSSIIFTDDTKTKVYPFYIESFKGGFYSYLRNTTNETIIKIFINENVTGKTLIMYYNYNTSLGKNVLDGEYNFYNRTDFNNNPFLIYQVFNDLRWNQSFANATFRLGNITNYNRSSVMYLTHGNTAYNIYYPFVNQINSLNGSFNKAGTISGGLSFYSFNNNLTSFFQFTRLGTFCGYSVLNSSGQSNTFTTLTCDPYTSIKISFKYAGLLCGNSTYFTNSEKCINSTETIFNLSYITSLAIGGSGTDYIYSLRDKDTIASTYTISNLTNTSFLSASIGLTSAGLTNSFINDIPVYGQINSKDAGYVSCYGTDNLGNTTYIGYLNIPNETNYQNHNFIFNYYISNKTYFYDPTLTNVSYYCCFYANSDSVCTSNMTIPLSYQRIFISNIKPVSYYSYSPNNVPASLSIDYSNNVTVNGSLLFNISTLSCSVFQNNTCYDWSITLQKRIYSNYNNPTSYSDTCQDCNGCYINSYAVQIADYPQNNIISRIYCTSGASNTTNNSAILNQSCFINYIPAGTSTGGMNAYFWSRPDCYVGSFAYSMIQLLTTDANYQKTFLIILTIFCNFYFLTLFIAVGAWFATIKAMPTFDKSYLVGMYSGGIAFLFFLFQGWIPIDYTFFILFIIAIVTLYIWKRAG